MPIKPESIARRLRLTIRRIVEAKTATHTIKYVDMTDEQKKGMDQAFAHMDDAFKEMDRVFGLGEKK